jgi:conjugal transfer pilus assembly protein TraF
LLLIPATLFSGEAISTPDSTDKKGYWWYEVKPEPQKEEEPSQKEEAAPARKLPEMKDYSLQQLWEMHPDDFAPLLTEFQKKAVQSPTEGNVKEYFVIQDIAMRKARTYSNVASSIVQKYPALSRSKEYPASIPGQAAFQRQKVQEIQSKIDSAKEEFALLYFYSPYCEYCKEQAPILEFFTQKHAIGIKGINIVEAPAMASQFRVYGVPAILLIRKGSEETYPVSSGVVSLDVLEDRIYRGIRLMNKEIEPAAYSMYDFQRGTAFDPTSILGETK